MTPIDQQSIDIESILYRLADGRTNSETEGHRGTYDIVADIRQSPLLIDQLSMIMCKMQDIDLQ